MPWDGGRPESGSVETYLVMQDRFGDVRPASLGSPNLLKITEPAISLRDQTRMAVHRRPPRERKWDARRDPRSLADVLRDPFEGIGKPERLSHSLSGMWSRRIDEEHRLVFLLDGADVVILQARYHYEK
jgi:toxin YoeB